MFNFVECIDAYVWQPPILANCNGLAALGTSQTHQQVCSLVAFNLVVFDSIWHLSLKGMNACWVHR